MGAMAKLPGRSRSNPARPCFLVGQALVGLLWLAGCATDVQPPPKLDEVCLADQQGICQAWSYAGDQVQLRLTGTDLSEVWEVDLGNEDPPNTYGSFRAWLGPLELDSVHRAAEGFLGQETLMAEFSGGLPPGTYPVEIETPGGQRAAIGGSAFEIRDPLHLQLALDKPQLPRGDVVQLTISIQNRGSARIESVALELSQGGTGAFRLPPSPAPFSLEGLAERDEILSLEAGGPGEPQLAVVASGLAAGWIPLNQQSPTLLSARIVEQALLDLEGQVSPPSLAVGQPFQLLVQVTNNGGVAVRQAQLTRPEVTGDGAVQWALDPGQVLTIEPGATVTFSWSGTAAASGSSWVSTTLEGVEDISGRTVQMALTGPIPLEILSQ